MAMDTAPTARVGTVLAFFLALVATPVARASIDFEIRAGVARSDNLTRSEDDPIDDTIGIVGLRIDTSHESSRFTGFLRGDIEYRKYEEETADNEDLGAIAAMADFGITEESIRWVANLDYGSILGDPFVPDTPENRQNIRIVSTGPDLRLRLGSRWRVELSGRHTDTHFEVADNDNTQTGGRLGLVRALLPNRYLSLNVTSNRYEFDDTTTNSNFDRYSAYLSLVSENSRSTLEADVGVNEIHDLGETVDDWMTRISYERRLSSISSLVLTYNRAFASAGDFFGQVNEPTLQGSASQEIAAAADPFLNQTATLRYSYSKERATAYLSGEYRDFEYVNSSEFDRDWRGIRAGIGREIGRGFRVDARVEFARQNFDLDGREDDDLTFGAGVRYRMSRRLSLSIDYVRWDRDSSADGFGFEENQYFLMFRFDNGNEQ